MTQPLGVPVDLAEDLSSIPNTSDVAAHNPVELQFQGIRHPRLTSVGILTFFWYTHIDPG